MVKRTLSSVSAKLLNDESELAPADKPKVPAGIDTDGSVFQITLPLMVNEADLTISEGKKQDGTVYDKANVCFKFAAKGLTLGVKMEDGSTRYYKIKNNAGPYGADRYISFGFDPSVFFTRPAESAHDADESETVTEHVPPMEQSA
jgi:hypothetical protein